MRERSTLLLAALIVAAIAAVPVVGLAATGDSPAQTNETNASNANTSVAPGEQLAGVMSVQEAELEGEVDERAFGISVASAASNQSKAEVVSGQLAAIEQRLTELQERKQELREARNDSEISEGRYRAEVSELVAKTETAKRLAAQSENVSRSLPAATLKANNITVTAIQVLHDRASEVSGPEIAEIARGIAGPGVGTPADERPERPERAENPGSPAGQPSDDTPAGNETAETETVDGTTTDGEPTAGTTDGQQPGQRDGARETTQS